MPLITLRGARMVKSLFGLVIENNTSHSFTRCCCLKANEGKASYSPIFNKILSALSCSFPMMFSSTGQQPCSLTDPSHCVKTHAKSIGFSSGNFIVRVSGLSLLTMPPCEQKTARRLFHNHFGLFSSSRYSLALLGLKGDQNLIC